MLFRVLSEIKLVKQPKQSNWCWAACGEMILKSFGTSINEDASKCAFMSEYTGRDCCPENKDSCNKSISVSDIEAVFGKKGIIVNSCHSQLENFEFIKDHLENSKTPLILGLEAIEGDGNHMALIYGYGTCQTFKYLLILDPIGRRYFVRFTKKNFKYSNNYLCKYLWSTDGNAEKKELKEINGPRLFSDELSLIKNTSVDFGFLNLRYDLNFHSDKAFVHLSSKVNMEYDMGAVCYLLDSSNVCDLKIHYSNVKTEVIQKALESIYRRYNIGDVKLTILDIESHLINAILIKTAGKDYMIYPYQTPKNYELTNDIQDYDSFINNIKSKEVAKAFIN